MQVKNHSAYPLAWPEGWKRTLPSRRSRNRRYRISLKQSLEELLEELRKMVGDLKYTVISSNIPTKRNGHPYITGDSIKPKDPGVAVYWYDVTAKTERVIACDAWVEVRENIHVIGGRIYSLSISS